MSLPQVIACLATNELYVLVAHPGHAFLSTGMLNVSGIFPRQRPLGFHPIEIESKSLLLKSLAFSYRGSFACPICLPCDKHNAIDNTDGALCNVALQKSRVIGKFPRNQGTGLGKLPEIKFLTRIQSIATTTNAY